MKATLRTLDSPRGALRTGGGAFAPQLILALLLVSACSFAVLAQTALEPGGPNAPDPRQIVGDPQGPPLTGPQLDTRVKEVASLLRCPVCQGLSVYDSPAPMALNMKRQVADLLAVGYQQDQVLAYFERSYGEFVLLAPPKRGLNWVVWIAPFALVALGGFVFWRIFRKPGKAVADAPDDPMQETAPGRDTLPDDAELARWVLEARELAYGWSGGRMPGQRES
ncbi:MAG TPA: cytochrome c-type biogenesis protein [Thermoanaerobaculia bacterium]|nr:cytochrome c-type biogenesis protein [Thermoanaerobaculia bacterium]